MTPAENEIPGRVPIFTKIAYAIGAIAYGIKENGFTVFLMLYYNQVVGLSAGLVGTVIFIALVCDAIIDPVIGVLSDRTHTRWGRRHPWLYGSALPIAISWMMLWFPPQGSDQLVLGWLLVSAILARAAIATNEVPSLAMAPEMTLDYHERTAVLRYRYLFGWTGGLIALIAAYRIFLSPPFGAPTGPGAQAGLQAYGIAGAIAMATVVIVSALGTHRRMAKPPAKRIEAKSMRATFGEMRQAMSNRAFVILMISGIFGYTNTGLGLAISQYHLNYVWQLTPTQLTIYAFSLFAGIVGIFFAITPISRALGKIRACALLLITGSTFVCASYVLRLLGLFPAVGDPALLPTFLFFNTVGTALGTGGVIVAASMMSDVVEASEEVTGRREEGLFFAGALFMQKTASGLGIFLVGLLLAAAAFPEKAVGGSVPVEVLDRMTLYFVIATITLSTIAALAILRFPFGEAEHNARVAKLAVASDN
jgi:glycoside/pentoside/hexuronide:cation symporter, GPH family